MLVKLRIYETLRCVKKDFCSREVPSQVLSLSVREEHPISDLVPSKHRLPVLRPPSSE